MGVPNFFIWDDFGGTCALLWSHKVTSGVLALIAIIFIGAGAGGPVAIAVITKQDRLIDETLPLLASSINNYAKKNNKLPDTLAQVRGSGDSYIADKVKMLVDKNLVRYTKDTKISIIKNGVWLHQESMPNSKFDLNESLDQDKVFYYKLCATYTREKKSQYDSGYNSRDENQTSPNTSRHGTGEVCYDLQTGYIY